MCPCLLITELTAKMTFPRAIGERQEIALHVAVFLFNLRYMMRMFPFMTGICREVIHRRAMSERIQQCIQNAGRDEYALSILQHFAGATCIDRNDILSPLNREGDFS